MTKPSKKIKINLKTSTYNRKRNRRKRVNNNTSYMFTSKVQTMGVGKTTARITKFYLFENAGNEHADFVSNIVEDSVKSDEFKRLASDFTYCRLKSITITKTPASTSLNYESFLKIDWYTSDPQDVRYDDNSKLIPFNNIKAKTFTFKPPNALVNVGNINYNLYEWQICQKVNDSDMPGYLKLTTQFNLKLIIEVKWTFRGAKYTGAQAKVIVMKPLKMHDDPVDEVINDLQKLTISVDKVEQLKEEEEEKESEEEEKEVKNEIKIEDEKDKKKVKKKEIKNKNNK